MFVLAMFVIAGCMQRTDPVTGEVSTVIDPNKVAAVEGVVTVVGTTGVAFAPVFPIAGAVGTALLGMFGTWLKMKPGIVAAENRNELSYEAGKVMAEFVEHIKTTYPDKWDDEAGAWLKNRKDLAKLTHDAENLIRGWRQLLPKP